MIIDAHCHYSFSARPATAQPRFSFEPVELAGVYAYDACIAPRALRRLSFRWLRKLLGIPADLPLGEPTDRALEAAYRRHLEPPAQATGAIDATVLLAFDAYHDDDGRRPPLPVSRGELGSDMYTSNSLVRAVCAQSGGGGRGRPPHPKQPIHPAHDPTHPAQKSDRPRFLFGASVHPYRKDAPECIDEVADGGAVLLKWIPLHQNIDAADPRTLAVLRRCARRGLPLLVHYSGEFTLTTQHRRYQDVSGLLDVLRRLRREGCMPPVIVAHVATPVTHLLGPRHDHEALLEAMTGEFADAPLFADISALTTPGKTRYLRTLARRQDLHTKLLFGSDFPVPVLIARLRRDLGEQYRQIASIPSWPERALAVFRHVGFNEIVFHRAAEILPGVTSGPSGAGLSPARLA